MLAMNKSKGLNNRYLGVLLIGLIALSGTMFGGRALVEGGPNDIEACDSIPAEARETIEDVKRGGPYEHPGYDDTRFGNYENVLPEEELGYYREYTVDTPGLGHRGERRIVTGGGADGVVDDWYYTGDHYETFCEVPGV
ncbi:MAG: ribonuclease domain-containing protein [Corynebacterium sp.]|nr:ribonuclease domain-containing protein [Corynebacterium sp.]MDY5785755.1 ribonuclease domain-containing protein [Corynebacterium sp.]